MRNHVINSVIPVSTGRGAQHKEHRKGSFWPQLWWVLTSKSWVEVPINFFVIDHKQGLILFDTGIDPAIKTDPNYIDSAIGRFLLNRIFKLDITSQDSLGQKMTELGFDARSVSKAIISHLHFDHVGGIAEIPQAELIVNQDEWQQLAKPHPEYDWILREHIELPDAKWHPFEFLPCDDPLFSAFGFSYDVMGDGSLILLPTPGHTPGSISMLIRDTGMKPVLLIGDLTYDTNLLLKDQVPGTGDGEQLRRSYAKVRALKQKLPDLLIVPSHDPVAEEGLRHI